MHDLKLAFKLSDDSNFKKQLGQYKGKTGKEVTISLSRHAPIYVLSSKIIGNGWAFVHPVKITLHRLKTGPRFTAARFHNDEQQETTSLFRTLHDPFYWSGHPVTM